MVYFISKMSPSCSQRQDTLAAGYCILGYYGLVQVPSGGGGGGGGGGLTHSDGECLHGSVMFNGNSPLEADKLGTAQPIKHLLS